MPPGDDALRPRCDYACADDGGARGHVHGDLRRRFAELVLGNLDDNGFLDLQGTEREDGTRTPDLTLEGLRIAYERLTK